MNRFLFAGTLLAALLFAEAFLRLAMPVAYLSPPTPLPSDAWRELLHQRSAIPGLDYELRPNMRQKAFGVLVETNRFGMRDREPLPDDTPSLFRIAVLGDSYTFGRGVAGDLIYPSILGRMLNESSLSHSYRFNVLNFGVTGYGSKDEALVFEYKARLWHPRLVIISYVLNDPETDPIQPLHAYYSPVRWWQHSHLIRLVAQAENIWRIRTEGKGNYTLYLHRNKAKWASVQRAFARIRDLATRDKIRVLVAINPLIPQTDKDSDGNGWTAYPYREIHAQVQDLAQRNGFTVVDLLGPLSQYRPETIRLTELDAHPNALGHQVAAKALVDYMTQYPTSLEMSRPQ